MNNMWQLSEGKTDGKLSIKAALRELDKKTGLMVKLKDLKFLLNDFNYNCDMYTLKVHPNTELDLIEPDKNEEWKKFSFEIYKRIVREDYIILTHTICIKLILHKIKLKS